MLNLNDLLVFVQVVDHRGFARAARALDVPKSTLSKRLAELERHLGARLINRTSRSFAVTDVGQALYRHAAAMALEAEAAEGVVRGLQAEPSGIVRITASVPTTQYSLAGLLPELALAYPKIRLVMHATDRFVDVVQEGFDIVVRDHFAPLADSGLVQRQIGTSPIYIVAAPAYLARRGMLEHPSDIGEHDGLMISQASKAWTLTDGQGRSMDVQPMPRLHADETSVLLAAAEAGLGITVLPSGMLRRHLEEGRLVHLFPGWTAGSVTTTLLMPHRRGQLPSVRACVDFIAQKLSSALTP